MTKPLCKKCGWYNSGLIFTAEYAILIPMKTTAKKPFSFDFTHSEDTFMALAHTQYDLFCKRNLLVRSLIAIVCLGVAVFKLDQWWAYILIAYGVYLFTGKYNQANHTVRKMVRGIHDAHLEFPSSRYIFEEDRLRVISLPDMEELPSLPYEEVRRVGKDPEYYYVFRDEYGGYMIPRNDLGDRDAEFAEFLSEKTGQLILTKRTPPVMKAVHYLKQRGILPTRRH